MDLNETLDLRNITLNISNISHTLGGTSTGSLGNVAHFQASTVVDIFYIVIGTIGMIGNFLVIIVILSGKRMLKKITNMLVLNQSFADFAVSTFLICTSSQLRMPQNHALAEFVCRFWDTKFPLWSVTVTSTYNLVLITLERYFEIVHPIRHKVSFTRGRAKVAIALVWLFGPIWQSYFFFVSALETYDSVNCLVYSIWPSETFRQVFGVFIVFIQFMVPLFILIYVYSRIIYVINNRIHVTTNVPNPAVSTVAAGNTTKDPRSARGEKWHGAKRNTMKTMALVAAAFVLCWSQNQIYYLMMNLGFPADFSSPYYHFTAVCVFCNCSINPFIYALKYREFQQAARHLLRRCFPCLVIGIGNGQESSMTEQSNAT